MKKLLLIVLLLIVYGCNHPNTPQALTEAREDLTQAGYIVDTVHENISNDAEATPRIRTEANKLPEASTKITKTVKTLNTARTNIGKLEDERDEAIANKNSKLVSLLTVMIIGGGLVIAGGAAVMALGSAKLGLSLIVGGAAAIGVGILVKTAMVIISWVVGVLVILAAIVVGWQILRNNKTIGQIITGGEMFKNKINSIFSNEDTTKILAAFDESHEENQDKVTKSVVDKNQ